MAHAVICDFGGVLTSPLVDSFARFQDRAGLPLQALGRAIAAITEREGRHPLHELECGRMSERDFLAGMGEQLEADLGRPVAMHEFTEHYWANLHANTPMIEFVASLRSAGVRTALLTNNVREWEQRWRAMFPVDELFEVVVDSAFVGLRKPDPAIYELTTQRLGVEAGDCVFIDDLQVNCDAARELGMTAVQFHHADQAIAQTRAALAPSLRAG